jgi:hypothetical protein
MYLLTETYIQILNSFQNFWEVCSLVAGMNEPLLVTLYLPYNFDAIDVVT